ncbi:hypothetical protein C0J52_20497 [Blattella germanica]|nr:hypothetical protein C0J52_20497 [Blattella germanica]
MATCKFGEDVTGYVTDLYEQRFEDSTNKKDMLFSFLLLQIQLHHPHGAKQEEGAAYAYNWEIWKKHLKSIFLVVDTEIHFVQKYRNKISEFKNNFLELAVEICKQVFQDKVDVADIYALNDTITHSMAKRRKVVSGIQAVVDSLNQDTWPWFVIF